MLVLSRKIGEATHIGNDIKVIVTRIRGNKISLAVDAPKSTLVMRGELIERARAASAAGGNDAGSR